MIKLETNDWVVLNNIIYKIHATDDFDDMRKELLKQLRMVIDYDSAVFFIGSDKEEIIHNPVTYNCDAESIFINRDIYYGKDILFSGKTIIYKDTDFMSDEKRISTEYYQKVYKPNTIHYALNIIISNKEKLLGVIALYRSIGKDDFRYNDIFILDMLKDHLSYRMQKYALLSEDSLEKLTINEAIVKFELSKREATVLAELMSGKEHNVICEELFITSNTLKKHILNIYRKMGINNRVQLFKMVKEKG